MSFPVGILNQEGRFELFTIKESTKAPGAPEGTFTLIFSPLGKDQNVTPITLPNPVKLDAKRGDIILKLP